MSKYNTLEHYKMAAKQLARARRIPHHKALDIIAQEMGQPHWVALTRKWEAGWRPVADDRPSTASSTGVEADSPFEPGEAEGQIDGHPYWVADAGGDVVVYGHGWEVIVGEAPSQKPVTRATNRRLKTNPILDAAFARKALELAQAAAEKARERVAADWPRRSTKASADGEVRHPLTKVVAKTWHCLHCDGTFSGTAMAANMWHCPTCSATPIDKFDTPFWKSPADAEPPAKKAQVGR